MGLAGQMNRQNLKSIALLRQFWGQFHQQSYHFQRRRDIVIIGRLLCGWWLDCHPCGFVIVVVELFIGQFRLDITWQVQQRIVIHMQQQLDEGIAIGAR